MRTAFIDESEPGGGLDHTVYLMAAVLVSGAGAEPARAAVRAATPKRMRKLHWYEAIAEQRLTWLGLLTYSIGLVIVRYDGAPARTERRRRRCIERLVWELEHRGVQALVFESRGTARDGNDVSMLESLRDRGVGRDLRYEHARGVDEPLLALADIACGAHARGVLPAEVGAAVVVTA